VTETVLRLDRVVVREGERTLLDVDELRVVAGKTLALIGPNGAGKTTLLHVAALLRRTSSGTVTISGITATSRNATTLRRALSVVFQDPLLFDVSVLDNTAAGLRFQGRPRQEAEWRARTCLERFGVAHLARRKARSLSGGEAARVALARAFATEPSVLLLDEPFSALDAPTRASMLPALRRSLREAGAAALLVTHDRDEAFTFGDRVAVMTDGHIVATGEAPSLIAHPPSREAARLLGVENILFARVTGIDSEYACIALQPEGPSVRTGTPLLEVISPGVIVSFTLPAGSIRILRTTECAPLGWNALPGSIVDITPLSSGLRLVIETPAPMVAFAPWVASESSWVLGEPVLVTFPPASAHLIPEVR
jgi:tungstate transport system ATP-binding protein